MHQGESRQIIIEIAGDGKALSLRKDETASIFERNAFLSAIIQSPDIPIIPLADVKEPPPALANKTNNKNNGNKSKSGDPVSKGNKRSKSGKQ